MKEAFAIKTGKVRRNEAVSNTGTLTFINDWWERTGRDHTAHGGLDKTGQPSVRFNEQPWWYRLEKPTDPRKMFERMMVYTTGSGRYSNEPYAKMGRTFFVKTKELEEPRMMIEIDETNLQKYEVKKFNPQTLKFDIPYTGKL